jgi:hypothetical protein
MFSPLLFPFFLPHAGMPFYDCDSDCRNFWLYSKLSEDPALCKASADNTFAFLPLVRQDCSAEAITQQLKGPHDFEVDGMLFFNKEVIKLLYFLMCTKVFSFLTYSRTSTLLSLTHES